MTHDSGVAPVVLASLVDPSWWALSFDERDQRHHDIVASLTGLHEHLGDGWIAERTGEHRYNNAWELTGPGGERLRLSTDEGRVTVTAEKPVGVSEHVPDGAALAQRITLSVTKSHARIARDIQRRILVDYAEALPRAFAAQRTADDARAARAVVVEDLALALAPLGEVRRWDSHSGSDQVGMTAGDHWDGAGSVTVDKLTAGKSYQDEVKLRVPRGCLVAVCAAVVAVLTADEGEASSVADSGCLGEEETR